MGTVSDHMARIMAADSDGLVLRYVGRLGKSVGNCPAAALMAACTSRAAALMSRSRSNCRAILVEPSWLLEVISVMPAMRPNCRSRGVATADARVSGLAPGKLARTEIVGKSIWG